MQSYAEAFISDYNKDISYFNQSTWTYFPFYAQNFSVTTYISSSFGSAIRMEPASNNETTFQNTNVTNRIEFALFGGYSFPQPNLMFNDTANGDNEIAELSAIANNASFVQLGSRSSLLIEKIRVESVAKGSLADYAPADYIFHFAILKGNNLSESWTPKQAQIDESFLFRGDLAWALNKSNTVREIYAEPDLESMLESVIQKMHSSVASNGAVGYSLTQEENDVQNIINLARTKYGITNSSSFVNQLLNYLESLNTPPQKTIFGLNVNDPSNWLFVSVVDVFGIALYPWILVFAKLRRKKTKTSVEEIEIIVEYVVGGALVIGITELIYKAPYDFSWLSTQTLAVYSILPILLFIEFLRRRFANMNHQSANQKPEKETDQTR